MRKALVNFERELRFWVYVKELHRKQGLKAEHVPDDCPICKMVESHYLEI